MLKLSKFTRSKLGDAVGKRIPVYISVLAVWFLTGLWHNATWNFIVWGVANGLIILISQELNPLYEKFHNRFNWAGTKPYHVFRIVRTFILMCFIRAIDRYDGVKTAFSTIASVFNRFDFPQLLDGGVAGLGLTVPGCIGAGIGLLVLFYISFLQRGGTDVRETLALRSWPVRCAAIFMIIFMIVIFGAYGFGYDARQFIYNQF